MRDWWLRTLLVLQRPRPVFVALRDEDPESVAARAEPVLLIVWLAGIAAILADATTYLDDATRDGVDLAIWVFAAGGMSGAFAYFVVGWFLYRTVRALGSHGTYRRARHVLAFAAVPVALSLVLWPVKLALYGEDWFRTGGRDSGAAVAVFDVLEIGLGQGAESEQLIRRGARWSGLDLTQESVDRVSTRLALRSLPHVDLRRGSALEIPHPDNSFDVVFSHGVLHHIPDICRAQAEIHRVLRPGGTLVAMLYARRSLNYQVSIRMVRRAAVLAAYPLRRTALVPASGMLRDHLGNAEREGLRH